MFLRRALAPIARGPVVRSATVEADARGVFWPLNEETAKGSAGLVGPVDHRPTVGALPREGML
eukprot:3107881-Alexandrium_andersonii.AAC.1